jgi:oligopeptide/dipeptide ABC transporter ATP-binding protein
VRSFDGHEAALPTWRAAQADDWLGRVSTRKLRSAVRLPEGDRPVIAGNGTLKVGNSFSRIQQRAVGRPAVAAALGDRGSASPTRRSQQTTWDHISHDLSAVHQLSHRTAVMYLGRIVEEGMSDEVFRTPHHPYSVGLLSSVMLPSPDLKRETTFVLEGEIPSPIDLPPGCPLVSRCPFRIERCAAAFPDTAMVTPTHRVHCYRHDEVAGREKATDTFAAFQRIAERVLSLPHHGEAVAITKARD